jgi:hypothetical protein
MVDSNINYVIAKRSEMEEIISTLKQKANIDGEISFPTGVIDLVNNIEIGQPGYAGGNIETDVTGSIYGNVCGNICGSVCGNIGGEIQGVVRGSIHGNDSGYAVLASICGGGVKGTIGGSVCGDICGSVYGNIEGGVIGTVYGCGHECGFAITGGVQGHICGDVCGNVYGNVYTESLEVFFYPNGNSGMIEKNAYNVGDGSVYASIYGMSNKDILISGICNNNIFIEDVGVVLNSGYSLNIEYPRNCGSQNFNSTIGLINICGERNIETTPLLDICGCGVFAGMVYIDAIQNLNVTDVYGGSINSITGYDMYDSSFYINNVYQTGLFIYDVYCGNIDIYNFSSGGYLHVNELYYQRNYNDYCGNDICVCGKITSLQADEADFSYCGACFNSMCGNLQIYSTCGSGSVTVGCGNTLQYIDGTLTFSGNLDYVNDYQRYGCGGQVEMIINGQTYCGYAFVAG